MCYESKLMYGFPLRGENIRNQYQLPEYCSYGDGVFDWADNIARNIGIEVVPVARSKSDSPEDQAAFKRDWDRRSEFVEKIREVVNEIGCQIYPAGCCEYRHHEFFVCAMEANLVDGPENKPFRRIDSQPFDPTARARLKRFAEMLGVPYWEPDWYLVDRERGGF